jgi:hypothetical protein
MGKRYNYEQKKTMSGVKNNFMQEFLAYPRYSVVRIIKIFCVITQQHIQPKKKKKNK